MVKSYLRRDFIWDKILQRINEYKIEHLQYVQMDARNGLEHLGLLRTSWNKILMKLMMNNCMLQQEFTIQMILDLDWGFDQVFEDEISVP